MVLSVFFRKRLVWLHSRLLGIKNQNWLDRKLAKVTNTVFTVRRVSNNSGFQAVLGIRIRRIRMFLGLQDPDLLVRDTDTDPDPFLFS